MQNLCFAQDKVTFIYINGSNTNAQRDIDWFNKGIAKFHPMLKKKIEKNQNIVGTQFSKYKFEINPQPKIFFWGDQSKNDIEFMHSSLDLTKNLGAPGAYFARSMISAYLHDAIWVSKTYHMLPILEKLNASVKEEQKKGNKVALFGYSAGTFVTYQYMFTKYRYVSLKEVFNEAGVSDDVKKFVAANPKKNTCLSAIGAAKIGTVTPKGDLIIDDIDKRLKENYLKIDEITEAACAPENVLGVVNYASPVVVFYSDLTDPKFEYSEYNKYLIKYIMENDLVFVTVNFREDPLGFPASRNLTVDEMEKSTGLDIESPKGIFYDNSKVKSWRSFAVAHTSYYSARRIFSNAIVKTMTEGYRFQYDPEFQAKMLKKRKDN